MAVLQLQTETKMHEIKNLNRNTNQKIKIIGTIDVDITSRQKVWVCATQSTQSYTVEKMQNYFQSIFRMFRNIIGHQKLLYIMHL